MTTSVGELAFRIAAFRDWCDREGLALTTGQDSAAVMLITGLSILGGRGSGKTYLLTAVERWMDETDDWQVSS